MSGSAPGIAALPSAPGIAAAPSPPSPPSIAARQFRSVLGLFATGVVAVTALDPVTGRLAGLAANSFTAVSLRPPLVSVSIAHTSTTWPRIRAAQGYCINILEAHQRGICLRLATPGADAPGDRHRLKHPAVVSDEQQRARVGRERRLQLLDRRQVEVVRRLPGSPAS